MRKQIVAVVVLGVVLAVLVAVDLSGVGHRSSPRSSLGPSGPVAGRPAPGPVTTVGVRQPASVPSTRAVAPVVAVVPAGYRVLSGTGGYEGSWPACERVLAPGFAGSAAPFVRTKAYSGPFSSELGTTQPVDQGFVWQFGRPRPAGPFAPGVPWGATVFGLTGGKVVGSGFVRSGSLALPAGVTQVVALPDVEGYGVTAFSIGKPCVPAAG